MKSQRTLKIEPLDDREIVMTRAFDAPRDLVFEAWTKPELLKRWFGPPGWVLTVCEVDLKVGGAYRFVWRRDRDGIDMGMGGVYQEIVRPERLVNTEVFDQAWYPGRALMTTTLVEHAGKTTVTIIMRYESRAARDAVMASNADSGVAASYDRLAELLASTPKDAGPGTATHDLVVTRAFAAPLELVWKAWTDPEHVKRWWGPQGFTAPVARIDLREGGVSLVCMRAPQEHGGQDFYTTWTYSKIDPGKRLEFILNFTDAQGSKRDPATTGMPPGIPEDVPHVITFEAVGGDKTEMTVREYGYTTAQAHDLSRAGLQQSLDKLAASLASAMTR